MGIRENIESIRAELEQELQRLDDVKQLEEARQRVLGKKGSLTALLRSMGQLSPEEASCRRADDQRRARKNQRHAGRAPDHAQGPRT